MYRFPRSTCIVPFGPPPTLLQRMALSPAASTLVQPTCGQKEHPVASLGSHTRQPSVASAKLQREGTQAQEEAGGERQTLVSFPLTFIHFLCLE